MSDKIRLNAREENKKSIGILEKNGIEFMFDWDDVNMEEMLAIRDHAADYLEQTNYIPAKMFDTTKKFLADYRKQHDEQSLDKTTTDTIPAVSGSSNAQSVKK
jgi:hypothetical protein